METYVIHVTKECNMNCSYCYENDKDSTYTWKEVKSFIVDIINNRTSNIFHIEFLGGEPLLAFDNIKKSVNYIESLNDVEVNSYTITTNGTILDGEIVEFLKEHDNVDFAASMDGTKFMNQWRTFKDTNENSHDTVIENCQRLIREIGKDRVNVHMVTHLYNVASLSLGVKHLYDKGLRSVGIGTIESTMRIDNDYCNSYVDELKKVSNMVLDGTLKGLHVDVLEGLKPKSDVRHYLRDESGKVVGETYGRAGDDVTKNGNYKADATSSDLGDTIYNIRKAVYDYHQRNKDKYVKINEIKQMGNSELANYTSKMYEE